MRKNYKLLICSALIGLLSGTPSHGQEAIAVEWAPFITAAGVNDQQLVKAANAVNSKFLSRQNGFLSRELVKKSATEYADIIHWKTKADAVAAGEKVNNCMPCGQYFSLMDMKASAKAGAGFSHYVILKKW